MSDYEAVWEILCRRSDIDYFLTNKLAKLNKLAALNISSIPTSVETSVTETIGVAPGEYPCDDDIRGYQ